MTAGLLTSLAAAPQLQAEETPSVENLLAQAGKGDVRSQVSLALCYRDGKGAEKNLPEALRWAHLAADQGDAAAMDLVGHAFLTGRGVSHRPEVAFGYFKAAAGESAQAGYNLGLCHFGAQGVEQNTAKALEAWKKAAGMGSGRAASSAAMVYLAGDGVPADPAEGLRLVTRAAELNDPSGLVVLGELQFRAGELAKARETWTRVSKLKPVGATGQPTQSSDVMAAQQGSDLLKLMDYRGRKAEPGRFTLLDVPHVHQGFNNCGSTACTIMARHQGARLGAWDYKRLCPSPPGTGTDWDHLLKASAKIGLNWKLITFTPDDEGFGKATAFLRSELDAGHPVVIDFKFVGPQYPNGEAGHTLDVVGYLAAENLFVLCNPAIASPGLSLITAEDLKNYWRSDHYSALSGGVLSRPALVIATP